MNTKIKTMKLKLCFFLITLGIIQQVNAQPIIESVEKILIKDAIDFGEIELGVENNIAVKSKDERYHVFNTKIKLDNNLLIHTPRRYYIFDKKNDKVHELKIKKRFENFYRFKFARFFDSKLVLLYEELMETNFYINEFNLSGEEVSLRKGICPALNLCKCYNSNSSYLIWIEFGKNKIMKLLDLNTNKIVELAQLALSLSADGNFHGSPKIELDHTNRKVLITNFITSYSLNHIKDSIRKGFIKPIAKFEIEEDRMIFHY